MDVAVHMVVTGIPHGKSIKNYRLRKSVIYFMLVSVCIDMEKSLDPNKIYQFPCKLAEVSYNDKFIVISVATARWLVFDNFEQLEFFHLLKTHSIGESLSLFKGAYNNAINVLVQIEAKDFENQMVRSCIDPNKQTLHFYLTNNCNLRCPHCYMFAGKADKNELTTEEVKKVLSDYKTNFGVNVTLSGGEVSTRKDLLEIVKYAYNIGLETRILTNGVLWTYEDIETISRYIKSVQISVDGYSDETYSKIRGKNNFNKVLSVIDHFVCCGVEVEVSITPWFDEMLPNETKNYADFALEMTRKYSNAKFRINFAQELLDGRNLHLSQEQKQKYSNCINEIYKYFYGDSYYVDYGFMKTYKQGMVMNNCMYGVFSVAANGDVYLCSRIPSLKPIGNVRSLSFEMIKQISAKAQKKSDIVNFKPCNTCDLMYICGGGCRIDYFPDFVQEPDPENINFENIPPRKCTKKEKERFYNLMIKYNRRLYK